MNILRNIFILLAISLVGCTAKNITEPSKTESKINQQSTIPADRNSIATENFSPKPIKITIQDLPKPFATKSASKPPQVLPIPKNPVFKVPVGFEVNIFAKGLDRPRWLALTPSGHILVTETRQNRITLLRDKDKNGVAEIKKTFATAANGLDIPFGMAFAKEYFFLGNHNAVRRYNYNLQGETITGRGETITDLPGGGYRQHWTRNLIVSPDRTKLYVSIGSRFATGQKNGLNLPHTRQKIQDLKNIYIKIKSLQYTQ